MDGLHVPAAAPWKQHFGGEEFWLEPLTLEDWATVEKRLVERRPDPIELAKASLDGLDLATKRELLESALRRAVEHDRATVEELKQFIEREAKLAVQTELAHLAADAYEYRREHVSLPDSIDEIEGSQHLTNPMNGYAFVLRGEEGVQYLAAPGVQGDDGEEVRWKLE